MSLTIPEIVKILSKVDIFEIANKYDLYGSSCSCMTFGELRKEYSKRFYYGVLEDLTTGEQYKDNDQCFVVSYPVSETAGGDCWGNNPSYREFNWHPLDGIALKETLRVVCPEITFLDYDDINSRGIDPTGTYNVSEYYGNSVDYRIEVINIDKLLEVLRKKGYDV